MPDRKVLKAFRLREGLVEWLAASAERRGASLTVVVEELLEDAWRTWELPPLAVESLNAEATSLGLGWRDYVRHVFFAHFLELCDRTARPRTDQVTASGQRKRAVGMVRVLPLPREERDACGDALLVADGADRPG